MPTAAPKDMPEEGKRAPAFTLPSGEGEKVRLSDFKNESMVVLYFYPKDNTPGCTKQAIAFSEDIKKFEKLGAVILGVSPDSPASHQKFTEKQSLSITLLSDEDKKVCEKYGVWVEKNMYGRKYMGVQRATFLIDLDGKIARVWPKVKVPGHAEDVLEAIKELSG